jgi:hypothetical protein
LTAEADKDGVVLRWAPPTSGAEQEGMVIRIYRKLLTPDSANQSQGLNTLPTEPVEHDLVARDDLSLGRTVDQDVRPGETYEYYARRIFRVTVNRQTLELAGELSVAARVRVAAPPN